MVGDAMPVLSHLRAQMVGWREEGAGATMDCSFDFSSGPVTPSMTRWASSQSSVTRLRSTLVRLETTTTSGSPSA